MFDFMYDKIGEVGKYTIYRDVKKNDVISFGHKEAVCPGIGPVYKRFQKTKMFKEISDKAMSVISPTMKRVYGNNYQNDVGPKLQTLRFGQYYHFLPQGYLSKEEVNLLKEGRRILRLKKGYFIPIVARMGCHNIYNQMLDLFDYAAALDRLGEEEFLKVARFYHKTLAKRDSAYIPRYKWLKRNPSLLTKMKAVVFQNHDDLIFMMLRAITILSNKEINTPFASLVTFEMHKKEDVKEGESPYFVQIKYNSDKLTFALCTPEDCPLEAFTKTVQKGGLFLNDHRFYNACYKKL